jgi:hypothetical protein
MSIEYSLVLLRLGGDRKIASDIDLDMDDVGMATDRTVFDISLTSTLGQIQWDYNLLTARITQITGFFIEWDLLIDLREPICTRRQLTGPQKHLERLLIGQPVIVSDFQQGRLRLPG